MRNTLVKKSLLGVRFSARRWTRDVNDAGGGGGAGSGDAGGAGGANTDDAGDSEEDVDAEEDGDDGGTEEPKVVPESKYLQLKRHLSESDSKRQKAENELKALKEKDLPDAEKQARELEEARESAAAYKKRFESTARTNAFLEESSTQKIRWQNATVALKLAELDDLEINEDGSVDGIKDAVKALAKDHPYLLAPKDSEEDGTTTGPTKSGSVVGSKKKGTKPEGEYSKEELLKRLPALGR